MKKTAPKKIHKRGRKTPKKMKGIDVAALLLENYLLDDHGDVVIGVRNRSPYYLH